MNETIAVQIGERGKVYDYHTGGHTCQVGDHVIVPTEHGQEYGTVLKMIDSAELEGLGSKNAIVRRATEEDALRHRENLAKAKEALLICAERVEAHGLDMKMVSAVWTFDQSKLIFCFTAEGRIDFRALVRDLAAIFHTRIELRQIGVRDQAAMIGGLGICGRSLCCHSFLEDFAPVSIKMAKEQGLSLNPSKISGCCGRLLCCLVYENDNYVEWHKTCPHCTAADFSPRKKKDAALQEEASLEKKDSGKAAAEEGEGPSASLKTVSGEEKPHSAKGEGGERKAERKSAQEGREGALPREKERRHKKPRRDGAAVKKHARETEIIIEHAHDLHALEKNRERKQGTRRKHQRPRQKGTSRRFKSGGDKA